MEPLSITASVVTLLAVACTSCQSIHSFLGGFADAPHDIKRNCAALQSLKSTLHCIQSLPAEFEIGQYFTENLKARLEECMTDLCVVETRVHKAQGQIRKGKLRKTWMRLRWSVSDEHWLGRFFARVQTYQTVFALELMMLQM